MLHEMVKISIIKMRISITELIWNYNDDYIVLKLKFRNESCSNFIPHFIGHVVSYPYGG